jgi:hypothetical protein
MEPEGSLPFSQEFATGSDSEPDESNPQPRILFVSNHTGYVCIVS